MKATIFLFLVFAMASFSVKAQMPGFTFGVKAGVNYNKSALKYSDISSKSGKAGYHAGVFARVGESIYFQPEFNFSGFASEYTLAGRNYQPKFQQLNLPLMVGYKLINTDNINVRVSLGPDISYNLKKPGAPEGLTYQRWNAGAIVNAGVDIGSITLDARYSRGLTELNKGLNEKTNLFSLALGYKFF